MARAVAASADAAATLGCARARAANAAEPGAYGPSRAFGLVGVVVEIFGLFWLVAASARGL